MGSTPRWRQIQPSAKFERDGLARGEPHAADRGCRCRSAAAPPATGQHDGDASQLNVTAKPAARLSDATPAKRGEGAVRLAAAAAPKRATTPPAPARDAAIPLAERIAIQFDLAWTVIITASSTASSTTRPPPPSRRFSATANSRKPAPSIRRSALCSPPQRRRKRPKSAGGWSTTPSAARLSACRPGRRRTRARAAAAPAGPRRKGRFRSRRSRSENSGTTLAAVYEQQKKEAGHAQARGQPAASGFLHPLGHAEPEEEAFYVRGAPRSRTAKCAA